MFAVVAILACLVGITLARPDPAKHFSKKVDVKIVDGGDLTTVVIGNLEISMEPRDDLIEASVAKEISEEVLGYIGGTLYTGVVSERRDCVATMFIKNTELIFGNIDCKRKHFVIEKIESQYVMHKKPQSPQKNRSGKDECDKRDQKYCTLFIHTDPYFWKHMRAKHATADLTREAVLRMMMDHILSANELYDKYQFPGQNFTHPGLQFVLAGFQIDDDTLCEDEDVADYVHDEVDYAGDLYDYEDYPVYDLDEESYEYDIAQYEIDNNFIKDQEYNDWNETEDGFKSILEMLRDPYNTSSSSSSVDLSDTSDYYGDYEDEEWNYPDAYKEDDAAILNGENCYENINGTIDTATEFCKHFGLHQSTLFLNMFSTVDHSQYCLAHIWTYRDLGVVGLADNPTEGAPGLSGYCAEYDQECRIGFNTGLVSFRHLGTQLSLADSQDTFIHELGHSFGAAHDPKEDSKCAPGGAKGNFLMYPGPLGNSFIRREFSPCSKFEIGLVLDETRHSCLLTRNELDGEDADDKVNKVDEIVKVDEALKADEIIDDNIESIKKNECDSDTVYNQLKKVGTYLVDLKHYVEDKKKKKVLFRINRKYKQILQGYEDSQSFDNQLKNSVKILLKDINTSLEILDDELEIFLARKISNTSKSIANCAQ